MTLRWQENRAWLEQGRKVAFPINCCRTCDGNCGREVQLASDQCPDGNLASNRHIDPFPL